MKKILHALVTLVVLSSSLVACATPQTAPTATPTGTVTPTATIRPSATPVATPTSATSTGQPKYGGVFNASHRISPRYLYALPNTTDGLFLRAPYESLMVADDKGDIKPWLATDWKFSPDYKTLTLTLRKGVKFHDGTDFNATAAKYNIQARKGAKVGDYEEVTSVDVVDDNTIRLNLSAFRNTLLISLWYIGGLMASPAAYEKYGPEQSAWNPVGTGPFKYVNYDLNQKVRYTRFDGYWQAGKPYLNGYEITLISDPTTLTLAFQNGQTDYIYSLDAKGASDLAKAGYSVYGSPPGSVIVFHPDSANADSPYAKKAVREAVEYAIDRENITKAVGFGVYRNTNQMAPVDSYAYAADVKGRPYDPAKAKQLLADAGYSNGFKTTIYVRSGTGYTDYSVAAATNLKAVGIDATVEPVDIGKLTTLQNGGWRNGLIMLQSGIGQTDWLQANYGWLSTTSSIFPSEARPPGLQDLFVKALEARDFATRSDASKQIVRMVYNEAMLIPLFNEISTSVFQKYVRNGDWMKVYPKALSAGDTWLDK